VANEKQSGVKLASPHDPVPELRLDEPGVHTALVMGQRKDGSGRVSLPLTWVVD